jgi:hypothetical protein
LLEIRDLLAEDLAQATAPHIVEIPEEKPFEVSDFNSIKKANTKVCKAVANGELKIFGWNKEREKVFSITKAAINWQPDRHGAPAFRLTNFRRLMAKSGLQYDELNYAKNAILVVKQDRFDTWRKRWIKRLGSITGKRSSVRYQHNLEQRLRNLWAIVLRRWPRRTEWPPYSQMASELEKDENIHFGHQAIRKILSGHYGPAKKLAERDREFKYPFE